MKKKVLHIALRPGLAVCLFLSQFTSTRGTFFTENKYMVTGGVILTLAGVILCFIASGRLQEASKEKKLAVTGPYRHVRHPIYLTIYIMSAGLGLLFFAWLWYAVLVVFLPLWLIECMNEEKGLTMAFGNEYEEYKKRTGMFFPRLFR